ncbi:MAG: hypothetical protein ACT443_06685, partial [Gemmatimonadota bacterium]
MNQQQLEQVIAGPVVAPGHLLSGAAFSEPVRVETVQPAGNGMLVLGVVGVQSERFRRVTLSADQLAAL